MLIFVWIVLPKKRVHMSIFFFHISYNQSVIMVTTFWDNWYGLEHPQIQGSRANVWPAKPLIKTWFKWPIKEFIGLIYDIYIDWERKWALDAAFISHGLTMDQQGQQSYDQYRRKLLYLNGRPKFCKPGASNEPVWSRNELAAK